MMRLVIAGAAGLLFGLGLALSDMIDPARVLAFVDVGSGAWDPTLAFVMGGAMIPMLIAWRATRSLERPLHGESFPALPTGGADRSLYAGAAMFGVGWGLVGFCPGPALAALSLGGWPTALFVGAMLSGMAAHRFGIGARLLARA